MKYLAIFFLLLLGSLFSQAQTELIIPFEIETPSLIKANLGDSVIKTESVDFNGDGKLDYIVYVKTGLVEDEPLTREYWFESNFKLFKKVDLYIMDYDFKFFINLDRDSVPEIFRASGYSDGIDYYFTKQNLKEKNETVLFYFNSIIEKMDAGQNSYYWGHPWRLKSIFLQADNENIKLKCSLNHKIIRDSEICYPENQSSFPVIIFDGEPKSEYDYSEKIESIEWLTISEILEKILK